jgi:hypothetical protein
MTGWINFWYSQYQIGAMPPTSQFHRKGSNFLFYLSRVLFRFPILWTATATATTFISHGSEEKMSEIIVRLPSFFDSSIISATGLRCFVIAMDRAQQWFNQIAKYFSEDGRLFGRNSKGSPATLRRLCAPRF